MRRTRPATKGLTPNPDKIGRIASIPTKRAGVMGRANLSRIRVDWSLSF
jgi:hypothetical protein